MGRRPHPHEPTAECRHCGVTFIRARTSGNRQVYCSASCRYEYVNRERRRRRDGPAHDRAITELKARIWSLSRSHLPRRVPTDVTPGRRVGRTTYVYTRVNSCPWCGGTRLTREPDGTWVCGVCPWFWSGWRPRSRSAA